MTLFRFRFNVSILARVFIVFNQLFGVRSQTSIKEKGHNEELKRITYC